MTSSPPSTRPQFRGKTLTPESPRPLHISEPSSIPILEKQIDPVFNLMSTHLKSPHALRDLTAMDHQLSYTADLHGAMQQFENDGTKGESVDGANHQNVLNEEKKTKTLGKEAYVYEDPAINYQPSIIAHEHSASFLHMPPSRQQDHPASGSILQPGSPAQHSQDPYEPFPATTPVAKDHSVDQKVGFDNKSEENIDEDVASGGVNYQILLDNIIPSSNAYPVENPLPVTAPAEISNNSSSLNAQPPLSLPPRPPPQEKPAMHPNYLPGEDIRSYHFPQIHHPGAQSNPPALQANTYPPTQGYPHPIVAAGAPGTSSAPNGLLPPPLATFQQSSMKQGSGQNGSNSQQLLQRGTAGTNVNNLATLADGVSESNWPPEMERRYDDFLKKERIYVSEGLWDRFPAGSRLFVGNLPTESVNKRELFQIFYKYGELAQISIKQAYGFIQYHDAKACYRALHGEQGIRIKDRNMHLEISKPQKNSRNAVATADGDRLRASYSGRRSRSPDYGRGPASRGTGPRFSGDRYVGGVPFSDFRDEPRRSRDGYRPMRSPSPRAYRGRDDFRGMRDRSPNRFYTGRRSRSRSPYGKLSGRYRSTSPQRREFDDDATLPIPRRNPRDVPDVQLILVEELDRAFVAYIEKSFRDRSLRCEVMLLPRVPLAAVINRQILEGVPAIVKLYRSAQVTGKIPLQVFDRSRGPEDVRFEEYEDLDAHVAAEIVVRGKTSPQQHNQPSGLGSNYPPSQYTPFDQLQQQQQRHTPGTQGTQPNFANMITSLDGPSLQKLLGAMQQGPSNIQTPQQHVPQHPLPQVAPPQTQDLASLLGSVPRQLGSHNQPLTLQGFPYPSSNPQQSPPQPFPYGVPGSGFNGGTNSHQSPPQAMPAHYQQQPQGQQHQQQQVQNIMEQLAKWKQ